MLKTGENESISDDAASVVTVVAKDDLSGKFTKLDLEDPDDCCSDDAASFVTADEFSTEDEEQFELTCSRTKYSMIILKRIQFIESEI